jgi:orotate phosphoribosyltransferase
MFRDQKEWIREYELRKALWMHDGNPNRPHAKLTSGQCSEGFFNSKPVIADEALLREAACDLLDLFVQQGGHLHEIDGVVGPQTGATKLAELLAARVTELTGRPCFWISPAKVGEGGQKTMIFTYDDRAKLAGKRVLVCDDVVTTAGSVNLTADGSITAGAATVIAFILALVNRSGFGKVSDRQIVGLISRHLPNRAPAECSLCAEGSTPLRPKEGNNWQLLNADY